MPSRAELELRAAAMNIDVTTVRYKNDSVLEQAVIFAEKAKTASANNTVKTPDPATAVARISGGANV